MKKNNGVVEKFSDISGIGIGIVGIGIEKIIPCFDKYSLQGAKVKDYADFKKSARRSRREALARRNKYLYVSSRRNKYIFIYIYTFYTYYICLALARENFFRPKST